MIVFALIGLLGGYLAVSEMCSYIKAHAPRVPDVVISQNEDIVSTNIIDNWIESVFRTRYQSKDHWRFSVRNLMTSDAKDKFDKFFSDGDLFVNQQIYLMPYAVTNLPVGPCGVQAFHKGMRKNGHIEYRKLTLLAVSRNDMRFKEITIGFQKSNVSGEQLISNIEIEDDIGGSSLSQFLREAKIIDSTEQFEKNILALQSYRSMNITFDSDRQDFLENKVSVAIELNPKFSLARYERAKIHYQNKVFKSALTDLNEAIKIAPYFTNLYRLRGLIHEELGHTVAAYKDFSIAVERDHKTFEYNDSHL